MDFIYDQLVQDYGAVTFEAFINLLVSVLVNAMAWVLLTSEFSIQVDITEDQTSADQLRESFRGMASDKVRSSALSWNTKLTFTWLSQPYVTELDLRIAQLPASAVEYLREAMPSSQTDGEPAYDYERWLDDVFAS